MKINDIINNVNVYGLEDSIKRAKYPMSTDISKVSNELTSGISKLANTPRGSGHDNFLKGIVVQFDLTFTIKAWTEAERYHFLEFISSQSTMHRITKFNLDEAYIKYVDPRIVEIMKEKVADYNHWCEVLTPTAQTSAKINDRFTVEDKEKFEEEKKKKYLEILYSNPCGFKLTAGMTTNYQQLKTIYAQRKDHRLPEWRTFCKWIETLPHSEFIISPPTNN